MRFAPARSAFAILAGAAVLLSCSEVATSPTSKVVGGSGRFANLGSPDLVISQVYGGGGNTGAQFRNDFIEIFNRGSTPVSLSGKSLQYTSATGSGNLGASGLLTVLPNVTLNPGQYFLAQEAGGTVGAALPTPDVTGPTNMAATGGKVAIVNSTASVGCNGGSAPCSPAQLALIIDLVGYDGANFFEGPAAAPTLSNTTAALRANGGCTDTDNNGADFAAAAPAPRNTSSALNTCGTPPVTPVLTTIVVDAATVEVTKTVQLTATAKDQNGNPMTPQPTFTWASDDPTVAEVDPTTGVATGKKIASTTVRASAGGKTGNATITVTPLVFAELVISQVYGGGGNSGATLTNDFIELLNSGNQPVSLAGWSVQYASSTVSNPTWQVTPLSNVVLQPGQYYLVQEAAGAAGTTPLPPADASGAIPMGAGAGKVVLSKTSAPVTGTCPVGGSIVDRVGYGTTNCDATWGLGTAATSNTTAAFRKNFGCTDTDADLSDFTVAAPAPRNTLTALHVCPHRDGIIGPLDNVVVNGATTVNRGNTITLTAVASDADGDVVPASFTWTSDNAPVASVSSTGVVTGVAVGIPAVITASTTVAGITRSGSLTVTVNDPAGAAILITGRTPTEAPVPTGFQDQLFASKSGTSTQLWESLTPLIATIDQRGVFTSLAAGNATFRVTMADGSQRITTLAMEVGTTGDPSLYGNNVLFGMPTAGGTDNDLLVERPQYTLSYNKGRGSPNWIAYRLTKTNRGNLPGFRCDCFALDPAVTAEGEVGLTTADFTGSGFDRGHMVRSNDRELGTRDQASTYYMSNIVAQFANLNQGRWGDFESYLQTVEEGPGLPDVYIIAGPRGELFRFAGNRIVAPTNTWKVVLVVKHDATLASINDPTDIVDAIAVDMPNVSNLPRDGNWQTHKLTIDEVEQLTGYDFFAELPDFVENVVESGDHQPVAAFTGATSANEGSAVTFDGSSSTDADVGTSLNDVLSYQWLVNGQITGTGPSFTRTFADNGTYSVQLVVTDRFGWSSMATQTVTIANVAPMVAAFAGADLIVGETYSADGSFADPGADTWTATVNYGFGLQGLSLSNMSFSLSNTYATAGSYTVTVSVRDDDGGIGTQSAVVTVVTSAGAIEILSSRIAALAGTIGNGEVNALDASLRNALKSLSKDNPTPSRNQLGAFVNKVQALQQSGRLDAATAQSLIGYAERVIASI